MAVLGEAQSTAKRNLGQILGLLGAFLTEIDREGTNTGHVRDLRMRRRKRNEPKAESFQFAGSLELVKKLQAIDHAIDADEVARTVSSRLVMHLP